MRLWFMAKRNLIVLGLLLVSACSNVPASIVPSTVPSLETSTAISFASRDTLTGEWIGAVIQPDAKVASIQIHFDDSDTELRIEPKTQSWKVDFMQNNESI